MTWLRLQSKSGTAVSGSSSLAVTYTGNVASGSKLIALVEIAGTSRTTTTVKDGAGNAFTELATAPLQFASHGEMSLWAIDTPAGDVGTAPTITATFSATSSPSCAMIIQEVSGLATGTTLAAMIDGTPGTNGGQASGASNQVLASPSYSSAVAGEYLVACFSDDPAQAETYTVPAGTQDASSRNNSLSGEISITYQSSAGGTETGGYTVNTAGTTATNRWAQILCAFQLAGGGTPANVTGVAAAVTVAGGAGVPASDSAPGYAATATDLGAGSGSWASPANAENAPDGTVATWTAP